MVCFSFQKFAQDVGEDDIQKLMGTIMDEITSREIVYEPFKELAEKASLLHLTL